MTPRPEQVDALAGLRAKWIAKFGHFESVICDVSEIEELLTAIEQAVAASSPTREGPSADALREALKTYGQHRVGCPHPSCPDCGTHTMAASKTPGYSYCTRCGCGSIPTRDEACDCGFEASLSAPSPQEGPYRELREAVLRLMNHIEDVIDDKNFEAIRVDIWNAVSVLASASSSRKLTP